MNYRQLSPRTQSFLFNNIEDWVSEENPVRLIDLLIDNLYASSPDKFYGSKTTTNDNAGRKAYHPALFCKLYLYGYLNRINSSRRLESECYRNIELMWLLNQEHPDFKTISNFRKNNAEVIRWCTKSFRTFLKDSGYIKADTVAYDGAKMKAYTSKNGYTLEGVIKRMADLEKQLDKYLQKLDTADDEDQSESLLLESELMERIVQLEEQVQKLQGYKEAMEQSGKTRYFPNDPESVLLKGRYGSYPGYNIQGGIDAKSHMVVSAEVTTHENDWDLLESNVEATHEQIGVYPNTVLADKGYANIGEIEKVESNGTSSCVVPLQESDRQEKDRLRKLKFTYNKDKDVVICPQGKELPLKKADYVNRHGNSFRKYGGKKSICQHCPKKDICNNSTRTGRSYYISHNEYMQTYKERTCTDEFCKTAAKRKGLIEHLFGTFAMWMGKIPILLKGKNKVQIEIDIYATAYNLRRLLNMESVSALLEKLQNYRFATK